MAPPRDDAERRSFEPSGFVAGLVFLAIVAGFALEVAGAWHPSAYLVFPALGIGFALIGVTGAMTRTVRRRGRAPVSGSDGGAGR